MSWIESTMSINLEVKVSVVSGNIEGKGIASSEGRGGGKRKLCEEWCTLYNGKIEKLLQEGAPTGEEEPWNLGGVSWAHHSHPWRWAGLAHSRSYRTVAQAAGPERHP